VLNVKFSILNIQEATGIEMVSRQQFAALLVIADDMYSNKQSNSSY